MSAPVSGDSKLQLYRDKQAGILINRKATALKQEVELISSIGVGAAKSI
ncbi:hypothetical protein [Undibacterium sp. TC9W]